VFLRLALDASWFIASCECSWTLKQVTLVFDATCRLFVHRQHEHTTREIEIDFLLLGLLCKACAAFSVVNPL